MIASLLACAGPPAPPEPATLDDVVVTGEVAVAHWHDTPTGMDFGAHVLVVRDNWYLVSYRGLPIAVNGLSQFDEVHLAPTDAPVAAVVHVPSDAWYAIDLPTGASTRLWNGSLWDGGTWSLDGRWYLGDEGLWDTQERRWSRLTRPDDAVFIGVSPDGDATLESSEHRPRDTVYRARGLDGTVLDEVVVPWRTFAWQDLAYGMNPPWPGTANLGQLWEARHVDWRREGGSWQIDVASEDRPWPVSAGGTVVLDVP